MGNSEIGFSSIDQMDPSERSVDELRKPTWIERISNRRHLNAAPAYAPNDGVLPSFFIVGPPRTGTSWLHEILRRHTSEARRHIAQIVPKADAK